MLTSAGPRTEGRIEGLVYRCTTGGARWTDPDKFRKDAAVLEAALAKEPDNARYAFYLAQSWRDAGEPEKALAAYAKRAQMGSWEEEVWYSLLEVAKLSAFLGKSDDEVIGAYLRAYEHRPTRAESLCYLARHLRQKQRIVAAFPFARAASEIVRPDDILFVDDAVYAWSSLDEYAVAAYWTGHYREALAANEQLLASAALPANERERIQKNLSFCREKVSEGARRI